MNIYEAVNSPKRSIDIRESEGETAAAFVYAFPPDIPLMVPGEVIKKESIRSVLSFKEDGAVIIGLKGWDIFII